MTDKNDYSEMGLRSLKRAAKKVYTAKLLEIKKSKISPKIP